MTAVMALILKSAIKLAGTITGGIAIMPLLRQMALAALLVWSISWLKELGVSATARWLLLAFYGFFPLVACYSVTVWKDIWLATISLLLLVNTLRVVKRISLHQQVGLPRWASLAVPLLAAVLFATKMPPTSSEGARCSEGKGAAARAPGTD